MGWGGGLVTTGDLVLLLPYLVGGERIRGLSGGFLEGLGLESFDQSSDGPEGGILGASLAQLGAGNSKSGELGHFGPNISPSRGIGAGEHEGPGTCWARGQTKLPLLKLYWSHPPQPTCPPSHLLFTPDSP